LNENDVFLDAETARAAWIDETLVELDEPDCVLGAQSIESRRHQVSWPCGQLLSFQLIY
jgi:hypothetical protein